MKIAATMISYSPGISIFTERANYLQHIKFMSHVADPMDNDTDTSANYQNKFITHGNNIEIEQTLFFKKRIIASVTFFISPL